jgi:hypothetical protein
VPDPDAKPRHTPGRWTYFHESTRPGGGRYVIGQNRRLAIVSHPGNAKEEAEFDANGRLMAAAPAMLEELKDLAQWLEGETDGGECPANDTGRQTPGHTDRCYHCYLTQWLARVRPILTAATGD